MRMTIASVALFLAVHVVVAGVALAQDESAQSESAPQAATPAETLATVAVKGVLPYPRGFYERKQRAPGVFLTRAEIEKRGPVRVTDLFRGTPGATVVSNPRGNVVATSRGARSTNFQPRSVTGPTSSERATGRNQATPRSKDDGPPEPSGVTGEAAPPCTAAVFLNGVRYPAGPGQLDAIPIGSVEAVEFYDSPARVPAQFSAVGTRRMTNVDPEGSATCGVILIWQRES
jgi:hypothetical protein